MFEHVRPNRGPHTLGGPTHAENFFFLSQNCLLVKETAQNKLVETMYIRSFSLESRVGLWGPSPSTPFSTECHKYR